MRGDWGSHRSDKEVGAGVVVPEVVACHPEHPLSEIHVIHQSPEIHKSSPRGPPLTNHPLDGVHKRGVCTTLCLPPEDSLSKTGREREPAYAVPTARSSLPLSRSSRRSASSTLRPTATPCTPPRAATSMATEAAIPTAPPPASASFAPAAPARVRTGVRTARTSSPHPDSWNHRSHSTTRFREQLGGGGRTIASLTRRMHPSM